MRLQLDSTQLSSVENRQTEAIGANGGASQSAGRTGAPGDSIALSGVSSALHQFTSGRAERLAQLAASVQNGSYYVPSSKLSAAIVSNGLA